MSEEVELAMELGWTTPSLRSLFGTNNGIAGQVLLAGGTDAQKQEWLPRLATGEVVGVVRAHRARRRLGPLVADHDAPSATATSWVITGTKRWITNAPLADVLMVFARTDADATAGPGHLDVPRPGRRARRLVLGARRQDGSARLVDLRGVPRRGPRPGRAPGRGRRRPAPRVHHGHECLAHGRLHIAALCIGDGRAAGARDHRLRRATASRAGTRSRRTSWSRAWSPTP